MRLAADLVIATALLVGSAAQAPWRPAPLFVSLFAPDARHDAYDAAVSPAALDEILRSLSGDPAAVRASGAWLARRESPADAFGRSGRHDRWALARLYGSRQPLVARGARLADGRVAESWTLISPYPAADFSRLEPGTLRIVLRIAP